MGEEAERELAELQARYDALKAAEREKTKSADELRLAANALINEANDARIKAFDMARLLRDARAKVETENQAIRDAEANAKAEAEFKELDDQFTELIKKAEWYGKTLEHQVVGAKRLAIAERAILGDRPGLGKSLTSLMTADLLGARKIVIVTPPDISSNFAREVKKWTKRTPIMITGQLKPMRDMIFQTLANVDDWVLIVAYSTWRRDLSIANQIVNLDPDMVVADEAHWIKSRETKAFRGLRIISAGRRRCENCFTVQEPRAYGEPDLPCCISPKITSNLKNVLLMTGTPLVNKPQDLFSLLTIIEPDVYDDEREFLSRYCRQDWDTQKWTFRQGGLDNLIKSLAAKFVARTREDAGIVLPPQDVIVHELDFDADKYPNQAQVINNLRERAHLILDKKDEFGDPIQLPMLYVLQLITRQRQAMAFPDGIVFKDPDGNILYRADAKGESQKIDFAYDLIMDLTAGGGKTNGVTFDGERVVVFSQFSGPLEALHARLQKAGVDSVIFNGDTPTYLREQIKVDADRSTTGNKFQVILANYKVGGQGLNMTAFTQMIQIDSVWNPANEEQAQARIDRMGQTENTTVHKIVVNKSIDSWMEGIIKEKAEMIEGFSQPMSLASEMLSALINGDI